MTTTTTSLALDRQRLDRVIADLIFCEDNLPSLAPTVAPRFLDLIPAVLSCEIGHTVTQPQWDDLLDASREYDHAVDHQASRYWEQRLDAARYAITHQTAAVAR